MFPSGIRLIQHVDDSLFIAVGNTSSELGLVYVDLNSFEVERIDEVNTFLGTVDNHLLVRLRNDERLHYYSTESGQFDLLPFNVQFGSHVLEYQNNIVYANSLPNLILSRFDIADGTSRLMQPAHELIEFRPITISPDKAHVLLVSINNRNVMLFSTENEEIVWERTGTTTDVEFLGNGIFMLPARDGDGKMLFSLRDGAEIDTVRFLFGERNIVFSFTHDLSRAIAWDGQDDVIIDTTEFRDWLLGEGLLFRPTTGVLTIGRVRVRQYPNLQAETFGYLEEGDNVEVLDRSGLEMTIGEMTDYWYRVRRMGDGLEGWAYGAFIDLAEEQGPIPPERS